MKKSLITCVALIFLGGVSLVPSGSSGQEANPGTKTPGRYKLIDLGTFGGLQSYLYIPNNYAPVLNNQGTVVGYADIVATDPFQSVGYCFVQDCLVTNAFETQNGTLQNLGVLPGGASSAAGWISPNGLIAGWSQNGTTDPSFPGFPVTHGVLWKNGKITDLKTLADGFESVALAVNSSGLVVGAADNSIPDSNALPHYVLAVLNTWCGPNACGPNAYIPENPFTGVASPAVTNAGVFAGSADLSILDPYAPACFNQDCQVSHAFRWENGVMTDLGTLPGPAGSSSAVSWVTPNGLIVGYSENGTWDPGAGGPAFLGALWRGDNATLLPPLQGGLESLALSANTLGLVVGISSNDVPDANSLFGTQTQTRAVVWLDGEPHDLGTLGGTDAQAFLVNELGQIAGQSYVADSIPPPNPYCTDDPLTLHAFFWEFDKMTDLTTLGGHCTFVYGMNDLGQIVGQSTTANDATSLPFLWQNGQLKPLDTVGGTYGWALSINDAGEIVGTTTPLGNQALLATVWADGQAKNLGTLPGDFCSGTDAINSHGQIVGGSGFNDAAYFAACTNLVEHAVLWQGGHIYDLNQFLPADSELVLNEATYVNDLGEINGIASLPNGDTRDFVLIPCDENHPDIPDCDYSPVNPAIAADTRAARATDAAVSTALGAKLSSRPMMERSRHSTPNRYRRIGALPVQ